MITHDHGLSAEDDVLVRSNWERTETMADQILEAIKTSRAESCAPWCVPQYMEDLMLTFSQFELVALLHVMALRLIDKDELDQGLPRD